MAGDFHKHVGLQHGDRHVVWDFASCMPHGDEQDAINFAVGHVDHSIEMRRHNNTNLKCNGLSFDPARRLGSTPPPPILLPFYPLANKAAHLIIPPPTYLRAASSQVHKPSKLSNCKLDFGCIYIYMYTRRRRRDSASTRLWGGPSFRY
jgi:hypothetical protein